MACVAEIAPSSVFAMESRALRCIYIKSDNKKKKINASLILESNKLKNRIVKIRLLKPHSSVWNYFLIGNHNFRKSLFMLNKR